MPVGRAVVGRVAPVRCGGATARMRAAAVITSTGGASSLLLPSPTASCGRVERQCVERLQSGCIWPQSAALRGARWRARILGPSRSRRGGSSNRDQRQQAARAPRDPARPRQRDRLADRLIDDLWGARPPPIGAEDAPGTRLAASRQPRHLERALENARPRLPPSLGPGSSTRPSSARAREGPLGARSASAAAADTLRDALALWRGPALPEFRTRTSPRRRSRASRSCGSLGAGGAHRGRARAGPPRRAVVELEALVESTRCANGRAVSSCSRCTGRAGRPRRSRPTRRAAGR